MSEPDEFADLRASQVLAASAARDHLVEAIGGLVLLDPEEGTPALQLALRRAREAVEAIDVFEDDVTALEAHRRGR